VAADLLTDAGRMAVSALTVAAVAGPVGACAWLAARKLGEPLLPRPAAWRVPWAGYDVVGVMLWVLVVAPAVVVVILNAAGFFPAVYGPGFPPPAEPWRDHPDAGAAVAGIAAASVGHARAVETATVRGLWTGGFALPLQVLGAWAALRALYPGWRPSATPRTVPARVALGAVAWVSITPVVYAAHVATIAAFNALGWGMDEHPLARLGPWRPAIDRILFVFQACVAAPLGEELAFRGILLPWLLAGTVRPMGLRQPGRVWVVLGAAVALAACANLDDLVNGRVRGAVAFAAALAAGWVAASRLTTKARTCGAVWASAALFAALHSSVWPTPVPLFVLGLGLGWLAVRTRGILVPTLVHGLFNAVSAVFVLNG
jgi:membrane protease YdiL (CAAX protease family)